MNYVTMGRAFWVQSSGSAIKVDKHCLCFQEILLHCVCSTTGEPLTQCTRKFEEEKMWQPYKKIQQSHMRHNLQPSSVQKNCILDRSVLTHLQKLFDTKFIMSVVHEFKVEMTCGGCSSAVQKVLGKLGDKVEDVNIDLDARTVRVKSAMSAEELLQVIQKTGKTSSYIGVKN